MAVIHSSICMVITLLYVLFLAIRCCKTTSRKIIIDTDAGGDDAWAIMLALMYETKKNDIEIIAITCTYGNTYVENVAQNVLKILTVANRNDIPVYIGAQKPLINTYTPSDFYGNDGFGDFKFNQKIIAKVDKSKHASVLLVDLVKQHPNEITIVSLAPVTNIALAIGLEPNFLHFVKQYIIMGSRIRTASQGSEMEFNFKHDPESNWIALNNNDKLSTIFPTDAVHINNISKEEYKKIYDMLNPSIASFLQKAERLGLAKTKMWEPTDGIAMAIALQPDIITQSFKAKLNVVISGDTRGSVVIDSNNKKYNTVIIQDYNVTKFKNLLLEYLS